MNSCDEFITDEGVRPFIHVHVEIDVDQELCDMPTQIHADEDVFGAHDIKKI
jgi:hypothetical protein